MNRSLTLKTVHDFIAAYLGDSPYFDDSIALQTLGLDKSDIEELVFRLEDEFGLTATTHEEDLLLNGTVTASSLSEFLQHLSCH